MTEYHMDVLTPGLDVTFKPVIGKIVFKYNGVTITVAIEGPRLAVCFKSFEFHYHFESVIPEGQYTWMEHMNAMCSAIQGRLNEIAAMQQVWLDEQSGGERNKYVQ